MNDIDLVIERLSEKIALDVERSGRAVMMIFGDGKGSYPFSYTIGNHLKGLPEMLLIGGASPSFGAILNEASALAQRLGRPFVSGEVVDLGGARPIKVIDARHPDVKEKFTCLATRFLGVENYLVQQVIVCDREGRFPGDPGCAEPYSGVPLMRGGH